MRAHEALFPQCYVKKPRQASALPWLFILSCRKISPLGVLRSFEGKILSNPYKSLSEPAQSAGFLL